MTSVPWIPIHPTAQARLATLGFGLLFVGVQGLQIDTGGDNGGVTAISITALVMVLAILLITGILQRQVSIWEGPATAVLAILVGIGLNNPIGVVAVCLGVVIAQSLYGSGMSELIRILSLLPVVPASVALSVGPIGDRVSSASAAAIGMVTPIVLVGGLLHVIKGALLSQEEAENRARHMADLTGDLLASETLEQSSRIVVAATEEMCRISPGVVIVGCKVRNSPGQPSTATITRIYGEQPDHPPAEIPIDIINQLPRLDRDNPDCTKSAQRRLVALGLPGGRAWYAHGGDDPIDGVVANLGLFGVPKCWTAKLFGRPGSRGAELLLALLSFSEKRRTAFAYLLEKEALIAAANRDDITGLPKRAPFLAKLDGLMAAEAGQVSLIVVGLDGLQQVVAQSGLASASMIASRSARLMLGVVGERGVVGRLSDARFAIAVPAAGSKHVEGLARTLQKVLSEPVQLDGRTVTLPVSSGIARAGAATSCRELVELATVALRLDQEAGRDDDREADAEPMVRPA